MTTFCDHVNVPNYFFTYNIGVSSWNAISLEKTTFLPTDAAVPVFVRNM